MSLLGGFGDFITGPLVKYLDTATGGFISAGIKIGGKPPGSSHPGGVKTIFDKPQAEDKVDIALKNVERRYTPPPAPSAPTREKPDYIPTQFGGDEMAISFFGSGGGATPGIVSLPGVGGMSSATGPWWQTLLEDVVQGGIAYLTKPKSSPPAIVGGGTVGGVLGVYRDMDATDWSAAANKLVNTYGYGNGGAMPGAGGIPSGYHLDKKTRSHLVKNRHTNYANGRAAMRAIRRLRGTRKMLAKIERMMPHRKCAPRPRRRR